MIKHVLIYYSYITGNYLNSITKQQLGNYNKWFNNNNKIKIMIIIKTQKIFRNYSTYFKLKFNNSNNSKINNNNKVNNNNGLVIKRPKERII